MKCFWCGKENTNVEINEKSEILKHFPCNICNQPERSKREDQRCNFCLNEESILTPETCCTGCGALNSMET